MSVEDCLFCKIANGEIPASRVFEDDVCIAFNDISPQAPTHILIIPRQHIDSLDKAQAGDRDTLGQLLQAAANIARDRGFADDGYRVVVAADGEGSAVRLGELLRGQGLRDGTEGAGDAVLRGELESIEDGARQATPEVIGSLRDEVLHLVRLVGDALGLRSGDPKAFSADALRAWAANPVGALTAAVPSITATGLNLIAPLLDDFLPAAVTATGTVNELSVKVDDLFTLAWQPAASRVAITVPGIPVPGIETLGLTLAISAAGLDELSVALGPADIDAGGVRLRPFASVSAGLAPAGGRRVMVGLSADDTHHFAARWTLDGGGFDIVASEDSTDHSGSGRPPA